MKSDPDRSVRSSSNPNRSRTCDIGIRISYSLHIHTIVRSLTCRLRSLRVACGAAIVEALATNPAAPAAAPFKNLRRSHGKFFWPMARCPLRRVLVASRRLLFHRRISYIDVTGWRIDFGCDSVCSGRSKHLPAQTRAASTKTNCYQRG